MGKLNYKELLPAIALIGVLILTILVYWPGLQGGFLFDDEVNLRPLGFDGAVNSLETLRSFLVGGAAGPTHRPLSLISFLLDDNTWPTYAPLFKLTNLKIHLLVGVLLCWNTILLLRQVDSVKLTEANIYWVAVLAAGFWILHPYFLSTTLYVVQRMTQLATLFVLLGLLGYLHGRSLLSKRPCSAYLWMSVSIAVCTLLAVLCKENGALLPVLILVVEFCFFFSSGAARLNFYWKTLFLFLPTFAIFGFLIYSIDFSSVGWASRNFTQSERMLTEGRVFLEYLYDIWLPKIERFGLSQDGYLISRSWLSPPQTLFAMVGVMLLVGSACFLRKKTPMISFAVLFFAAGHLLESTNLNLELYFEHRNYLPAGFMFLPLAEVLVRKGSRRYLGVFVSCLIIALLSTMLWMRANLWADTDKLNLYWAMENPESARARNSVAKYLFEHGNREGAIDYLEKAQKDFPENAFFSVQLTTAKAIMHKAQPEDYLGLSKKLETLPLDPQSLEALKVTAKRVSTTRYAEQDKRGMLTVLEAVARNPRYSLLGTYTSQIPYLKGHLLLSLGMPDQAYEEYLLSIRRIEDPDSSLAMIGEMANSGNYALAQSMLDVARSLLNSQEKRPIMRRSLESYERDFFYFERALREASSSKATVNANP
jgi:tetratricopeptide (TPR) repeat protein